METLLIGMAVLFGLNAMILLYRVGHPRIRPYSSTNNAISAVICVVMVWVLIYAYFNWI